MSGITQNNNTKTSPYAPDPEPDDVDISNTAINNCQFFNIATDVAETEPTSTADAGKLEELWLPGSQSCRVGSSYYGTLEGSVPGNLLQNTSQFGQQLDVQIEALVLSNPVVAGTYDTDSILRHLLTTVFRHALATGSIAKQYARATNAIRAEICSALATCHAQCARLCQARNAYMSSLLRLKKLHKSTLIHQQACVLCKGSLLNDLVELERLRCTAKRLQDSRHLIESMKLIKQHEACRRDLGQRTSVNSNGLDKHFLAEKAALQLLHASRLLDLEEIVSVFQQSCPTKEHAARKILHRVEQAVSSEMKPCTGESTGNVAKLQHGGLEAAVSPTSSTLSAGSCGSLVCVVSLLRLLHLEKILSMRFSTDTKRLLHLTRLERNFAYALEHLEKFLESVIGPVSLLSNTDDTGGSCHYLRECIEETKVYLEKCNCVGRTPVTPILEWSRGTLQHSQATAQFRLRMVGVAFFDGALRRTQCTLPVTASPPSCQDNLKTPSAERSSTTPKALFSSRWDARSEFNAEQAGLHHSSWSVLSPKRLADDAFKKSTTVAALATDKVHSLPSPSSSKTSANLCKEATLSPGDISKCQAPESQEEEPHMVQGVKEFAGSADNYTNTQCQLGKSGAQSESRDTSRELQQQGIQGLEDIRNKSGEVPNAYKAHGISLLRATPDFESRAFCDSEIPSNSTSAQRDGKVTQQFTWCRKPGFVSLLRTTREKLNYASTVIFSRYYGIKRSSQSTFAKGSRATTSTFVEKHSATGVGRRDLRPLQCNPTTRNRFQSLMERVGKRSCRRIVRQWVSVKRCESPASPRSRSSGLRQHKREMPSSHRILAAGQRGGEGNNVMQRKSMQLSNTGL